MSEKIRPVHLQRRAVVYVRQSSGYQLAHNEESRRLQYAMKNRVKELGWREIEVVDEDLGRSAAGTQERTGFERMVAEVSLGKVGAVAAREVSRFSRNSHDWQQLVEVCRVVDTLLIDQEAVYDPRQSNDRLLLGLKGSLNEYELDLLRLRSLEARREKARRGELVIVAPVGYVKTDGQRLEKDPDRRVQKVLELMFRKFMELGTVRQTMLWFLEHSIELPVRHFGINGWHTEWKRATFHAVIRILKDPIYAGVYRYGRTEASVGFRSGKRYKKVKRKPQERWLVQIEQHHEPYITREQFDQVQEMIANNAQSGDHAGKAAPKRGVALLTGVLRCARCARKLTVTYTGRNREFQRYVCRRGHLDNGEPRCISVGGGQIDDAVGSEVLRVVEPCAIEAAILAARKAADKQEEVLNAWRQDLEAARYAAARAWKQYDGVDPENRLVADELEHRWNEALEKVQHIEERITQEETKQAAAKLPDSVLFKNLAADLGAVWHDPGTDVRLKKRIVRTLIEEIIIDTEPEAGECVLVIHWQGGVHTDLRVARRRRGQNRSHTSKDTVEAVRALAQICPDRVIAGVLNRNGLRTGRGNWWKQEGVTSLRSWGKNPKYSAERQQVEGWLNLTQAAAYLGVGPKTLRRAVERGEVPAVHPLSDGPWIFRRDDLDQASAQEVVLRARNRGKHPAGQAPGQLSLWKSTT